MSNVSGLSNGLIKAYTVFQSTNSLSTKDMFKSLSLDVGGDGKAITKKQLDAYVDKAKSGDISVSDSKLSALKSLQENWDKISGGKDSITADNMKDYSKILVKTVLDDFTTAPDSKSADSTKTSDSQKAAPQSSKNGFIDDIDAYLIKSALGTSVNNASSSDLNSYLKTLLTGTSDENDDTNANLIASLTNLIANRNSSSTIETKA